MIPALFALVLALGLIVGGCFVLWLAGRLMPRDDFDTHADEAMGVANTWHAWESEVGR